MTNGLIARCPQCVRTLSSKICPTLHQSGTFADKLYWIACNHCGLEGPKEVEKNMARPSWNRAVKKWKEYAETGANQSRRISTRH